MSWSFDETLPTDVDKVRYLVGDTNDLDPLVEDEQIEFALNADANLYRAAARTCRAIALKVGQRLTVNASGTGINADEQYQHWMSAAASLEAQAAVVAGASAFVGGVSRSAKADLDANADRLRPAFTKTQHAGAGDVTGITESTLTTLER